MPAVRVLSSLSGLQEGLQPTPSALGVPVVRGLAHFFFKLASFGFLIKKVTGLEAAGVRV